MAQKVDLEKLLLGVVPEGTSLTVLVDTVKKGFLGFRKGTELISITAENVIDDISVSATIESSLREQYGYGQMSKNYNSSSKELKIIYSPLQSFIPEKIVKSTTQYVAGKGGVKAPEQKPVYRTAGSN